ncbi:intercellular adhesion molecule 3 [Octodon degus]|uniref:Intercellular adhesion molecule 3 n=1 Tax=Octodon degus TaxID=10160 RepID=A0A6P3EVY7_OCTDE|nr:intercellular adhesion molecule 3 [Octodon degus]
MMPARLLWGPCMTPWAFVLLLSCVLPRGHQGQMFPLHLESPAAVPAAGGPILVNCSTECPNPSRLTLETFLPKQLNGSGPGWATFWLSNLTEDSTIICSVLCDDMQVTASSNITLYHGANFSCRTELDLRSEGLELFLNTSASRQLRTFALPMTAPHLLAPRSLEVGERRPVTCSLDGLFPSSEAQVYLVLGNQSLTPEVMRDGDMLKATATVYMDQEGTQKIVCNVTLGGMSRSAQTLTTVFSFLGPLLSLSNTRVTKGSTVNVTCTAGPRAQVILDGVLAPSLGKPVQLQLAAADSDDGRRFICNATLEVAGELIHRSTAVQLRVLDSKLSSVIIVLTVLTVLALVTISGALVFVFGMQQRCGTYHVKQPSISMTLWAMEREDIRGEEAP